MPVNNLEETIAAVGSRLDAVRDVVSKVVVGQEPVIDQLLLAFLARGHALVEGVPGTAKTLLVRVLAAALGVRYGRIQFTPDLMPSDVTGIGILRDAARGFEFREGPVFTDLLLADEINRAPPKTQAALLEAMAERQITADGITHPLSDLFTVFATQNPVEHEGTFPLPEAQLDRFLLKIDVPYPAAEAELRILDNYAAGFDAERGNLLEFESLLTADEARALRSAVDGVTVAGDVRDYIARIVRSTRDDPAISLGGSPRATVALFRTARAAALLEKRGFVTPDDVKTAAPAVLRHRLTISPELQVEGRTADHVLASLLSRVPVPK